MATTREQINSLITESVRYLEHAIRQASDLGEWDMAEKLIMIRRQAIRVRRPEPTPVPSSGRAG